MNTDAAFYDSLPRIDRFADLSDASCYHSLPKDWAVGVADIQGSTQAIAEGRYKTVNMVGAAVISAQINQMKGRAFPYVFGGDGAAFALAPADQAHAALALSAVRRWALDEFGITLRVALVPVHDIEAAGLEINVARFRAASDVDYAMFSGGGVSWAEAQMKSGRYALPEAPRDATPDLTGLSCRWSPVRARNGSIVSLVLNSAAGADPLAYKAVVQDIITLTGRLDRGGHPIPDAGPGVAWPPPGVTLEAHARHGTRPIGSTRRKILFETLVAWFVLKMGLKIGGFDARHYTRTVGKNADFRKFDDGLKMTLDCDPDTLVALQDRLGKARDNGLIEFGLFQQDEAMMTCIVPSILTDDHLHFVDGASGGYTQAAAQIKAG
ncbi:hypothetical protein SuNHUV7_12140 (plasmid) [Pseudoseohaeicola sp. NH-UV-7]|uniref:DUF3095 domain-containing protein n=1 Tax=Sulfitobacter sp. TBRI5 TaxID=2989732 RepID=UPI003A664150